MDSLKTKTQVALAENNSMDIDHNTNVNTPGIVNSANSVVVVSDKYEQTHNYYYPQPVDTSKKDWNLLKTQAIETEDSVEIESVENTVLQQLQKPNTTIDDIEGALEVLLELSMKFERPRLDVINIILDLMQNYPLELTIHDLSLSILSHLKDWIRSLEYKTTFEIIIEKSINSMEKFSKYKKIFKTFLNILDVWRWDSKLQENASFKCIQLICEGLYLFYDNSIHTKSFKLILPLLEYLTDDQLADIGTEKRLQKNHLDLIMEGKLSDEEIITTLDMWIHLSSNHKVANSLANGHMDLLLTLLKRYSQNKKLVSKVLPIVDYIARLENVARYILIHRSTIDLLLLLVKDNDVVITYLSVSILSHAVFHLYQTESVTDEMERINSAIKKAYLKWYFPKGKVMTRYNSLKCLEMMMTTKCIDGIQLFVAWTLHYLCCTDRDYYLQLLRKENLLLSLFQVLSKEYILSQAKAKYEEVIEMYVNYFNINLCTDDMRSIENILTLLEKEHAFNEDKIISLLQTFKDDFLEKLFSASQQRALKILFGIAENHKNSICVQKIIISCLDVIINRMENEINRTEWTEVIRCTFPSAKLFSHELDMIYSILKLINISLSHLKTNNKSILNEFSLLNEVKMRRINNESQLDYVAMMSYFLSVLIAFEGNLKIIDNCMQCACGLISVMTTIELNTLIRKEEFRQQIYWLIFKLSTNSEKFGQTENMFFILNRLLHVNTMRRFWAQKYDNNFEIFFQFLRENRNENVVKLVIDILIVFATDYKFELIIKTLTNKHLTTLSSLLISIINEEIRVDILSLLMIIDVNCDEFIPMLYKLRFSSLQYSLPYPLSFVCNTFLRDDRFEFRLYAVTVLNNFACQDPVELKHRLDELGEYYQLQALVEASNTTAAGESILEILKSGLAHLNSIESADEDLLTFVEVRSILWNPLSEAEDIQRCLHLMLRNDWLQEISHDDTIYIINLIGDNSYKKCPGVYREGLTLLCFLAQSDKDTVEKSLFLIKKNVVNFKNHKTIIEHSILYISNVALKLCEFDITTFISILKIFFELLFTVELTSSNIYAINYCIDKIIYLYLEMKSTVLISTFIITIPKFRIIRDFTNPELVLCFLKYFRALFFLNLLTPLNVTSDESCNDAVCLIEKFSSTDEYQNIADELIILLAWLWKCVKWDTNLLKKRKDRMLFFSRTIFLELIEKMLESNNTLSKLAALSCLIEYKVHDLRLGGIDLKRYLIKILAEIEVKIEHNIFLRVLYNDAVITDFYRSKSEESLLYLQFLCKHLEVVNTELKIPRDVPVTIETLLERCTMYTQT